MKTIENTFAPLARRAIVAIEGPEQAQLANGHARMEGSTS